MSANQPPRRFTPIPLRIAKFRSSLVLDVSVDVPEELHDVRRALQTEHGQILNTRGAIHFKNKEGDLAIQDWLSAIDIWVKLLPETESIANPLFVRLVESQIGWSGRRFGVSRPVTSRVMTPWLRNESSAVWTPVICGTIQTPCTLSHRILYCSSSHLGRTQKHMLPIQAEREPDRRH
jgi:hypothetical protein